MSPRVLSGMRVAAPPKHSSGMTVTRPVPMTSATCPAPWLPKVEAPVTVRNTMQPMAAGATTRVSTTRLSTAPASAFFFASP